jgi:thioredoxin-dependent peroxiredoxin
MIKEGDKAPKFNLESTNGEKIALEDFEGETVVLYFYPKDDTPGCTKEACNFRDNYQDLLDKGASVIGISPDNRESHEKFSEKYSLPFPLLVDKDHKIAEKYGVWVEKNMYGKKSWGIQRSTFIIGPDGKVQKAFNKVKVDGHSEEVMAVL